jgi:FlaA1/EpsC-like NDP-sugar epimerase
LTLARAFSRANLVFAHDVVMTAASFVIAIWLRVGDLDYVPDERFYFATAVFTLIAAIVFRASNLYRGVWRYASLNDLYAITRAATLSLLIFVVLMFTITRLETLPRSLPFINWFVLIALLGGPRFAYRLAKDRSIDLTFRAESDRQKVPVLLVGAGDAAELFIRDVNRSQTNYTIIGMVSGSQTRVGRHIHGIDILGTIDEIPAVVEKLKRRGTPPQKLLLTSARMTREEVQRLLDLAESLGMTLAHLGSLSDFRAGPTDTVAVKPIDVEDLLFRPQTPLDRVAMGRLLEGRAVLVTGAGGSIGGELVRQLAAFRPAQITLVDHSEYNLFKIDRELAALAPDIRRDAMLADVRDAARVRAVFDEAKPEIVFHAAALKHVPMVEANMLEGLTTNVFGTVNVADAARAVNARVLVQISTDKAVNPSSIMGASKRMAEMYCQALDLAGVGPTALVTVRFGNVLGSTGSVVELFRQQLAAGGPLTVTDPNMTRYFMTVREAVELVLMASAMGADKPDGSGGIYVLDMGEPVRIMDLARQMIRLAGFEPGRDIEIEVIGARPGEKLFEEVLHGTENLTETGQQGLLFAHPRAVELPALRAELQRLQTACAEHNEHGARAVIRTLVPEYAPPQPAIASVAE